MLVTLIRSFIVYVLLIFSVRMMGKRQIGELQPTDLVVTILISEIAAIPIEDTSAPLLNSITSILLLVSLEIFISYISMKSTRFRKVIQGSSMMIIENGKIKQDALKQMRLTIDDLTVGLRQKDIFDLTEVSYAYVETNGSISAEVFPEKKTVSAEQLSVPTENSGIPVVVVSDGRIISENFEYCFLDHDTLKRILSEKNLNQQDILIMTADRENICSIIIKEGTK